MRKVLSIIFTALIICLCGLNFAHAKKAPMYKTSINVEGIGIIKLPQEFTIYEKPDFNSKAIKTIKWGDALGAYADVDDSGFILFYPAQNVAFMAVTDDLETGDWYEICYDQKNKLTGWVKPKEYEFYYWLSFFTKYGKANGLYPFRDLDLTEKRLYAKADTESQIISSFEKAKDIRIQIFRGNWVLVRVYDYEKGMKIGWLKWRTDEGKFLFFPNVLK